MSVAASLFDQLRLSDESRLRDRLAAGALAQIRQVGGTVLRFARREGVTVAADVGECGGFRIRMPRGEHGCETAYLNTGGGMVGGDRVTHDVVVEEDAEALVTTPAAERVYRTLGPVTRVDVQLNVAAKARLVWMPQETILFERSALARTLEADVAHDATLLVLEMTVLGRTGMGERLRSASLRDTWRVRRGGRLVFADNVRLDGDVSSAMRRPAVGGGATVLVSLLYMGEDATEQLDRVRTLIDSAPVEAGASAWNGLLSVRLLAHKLGDARAAIGPVVAHLARRPLPRLWWT